MVELEQLSYEITGEEAELEDLGRSLDLDGLQARLAEIGEAMEQEDFWSSPEAAQKMLKEKKQLEVKQAEYEALCRDFADIRDLLELLQEEGEDDPSLAGGLRKSYERYKKEKEALRIRTLLDGEYDRNNAILSLHAGTGGLEAQDWAEMLLRMYSRWAADKGYKMDVLDIQPDPEAGIKNATVLVKGENAYGYLKNEAGVHRMVRLSPFDTQNRRHTSFASVDVMPEIEDDIEVEINPEDLRIDTYRSSGAGGQHVNKTDSAIRITHLPTNIVVTCQNERSQHQNREVAMRVLKSKLLKLAEMEHKEKIDELKGDFSQIGWGSQIRSYVFHPYTLVKDHRTDAEMGNVQAVMDGDIDYFINEKLKQREGK